MAITFKIVQGVFSDSNKPDKLGWRWEIRRGNVPITVSQSVFSNQASAFNEANEVFKALKHAANLEDMLDYIVSARPIDAFLPTRPDRTAIHRARKEIGHGRRGQMV